MAFKDISELLVDIIAYQDSTEYRPHPIPLNYDKSINVNSSICADCKGKCCNKCGCHFSPEDFPDRTFKGLKAKLDLGYISIDILSLTENENYFLRVRNINSNIVDLEYDKKRRQCSLVSESGCLLPYEERPTGGKVLIPSPTFKCETKYDIDRCAWEWRFFQSVLSELIEYYKEQEKNRYYENQIIKKIKLKSTKI